MNRLLCCAALLLAACNTDLSPQFRVKDVRILAVRSGLTVGRAADVSPGDTLVLDALVVNPLGRPGLAIEWFACLPTASDAVSPCADLATLRDPTRLGPLATGPNPTVLHLGSGPSVHYTVPALADALGFVIQSAQRQPTFACRMYAEIVVVVVAAAEGRSSVAVKVVRVRPPTADVLAAGLPDLYAANQNPAIADVVLDPADPFFCAGGTSISAGFFPARKTMLCGAPASAPETYNVCDPGVVAQLDENLGWQWYVTEGDFPEEGGVGNATGDQVEFVRPSGPFTLWAILRDGRGGTDWASYAVSAL